MAYERLSEQDFKDFSHLLPASVTALITVAGFEAAFVLVKHLGGTVMPVGQNKTKQGKVLHAVLSEYVGEAAAEKIETAYAGQYKIQIPKCYDVMLAIRNRAIRRDFDHYTREGRMSSNLAINNLALDYNLAARRVWDILKLPDAVPAPPDVQSLLFV